MLTRTHPQERSTDVSDGGARPIRTQYRGKACVRVCVGGGGWWSNSIQKNAADLSPLPLRFILSPNLW